MNARILINSLNSSVKQNSNNNTIQINYSHYMKANKILVPSSNKENYSGKLKQLSTSNANCVSNGSSQDFCNKNKSVNEMNRSKSTLKNSNGPFENINKNTNIHQSYCDNNISCHENDLRDVINHRYEKGQINNNAKFPYEKTKFENQETNTPTPYISKNHSENAKSVEKSPQKNITCKNASQDLSARKASTTLNKSQTNNLRKPAEDTDFSSRKNESGLARSNSYSMISKRSASKSNVLSQDLFTFYEPAEYDKAIQENKELAMNVKRLAHELQNERNRNSLLENELNSISNNITQERTKYQNELMKISGQIKKLRNIQNLYVNEKKNSEKLENQLNQKQKQTLELTNFLIQTIKSILTTLELILLRVDVKKDLDPPEKHDFREPPNYQKLLQEIRKTLLDRIEAAESLSLPLDWKDNDYKEIIFNTKEQMKIYRDKRGGGKCQMSQILGPIEKRLNTNQAIQINSNPLSNSKLLNNKLSCTPGRIDNAGKNNLNYGSSLSKSVEDLRHITSKKQDDNDYVPLNSRLANITIQYLDTNTTKKEESLLSDQKHFNDNSFSKQKDTQVFDNQSTIFQNNSNSGFVPNIAVVDSAQSDNKLKTNCFDDLISIDNNNIKNNGSKKNDLDVLKTKIVNEKNNTGARTSQTNDQIKETINKSQDHSFADLANSLNLKSNEKAKGSNSSGNSLQHDINTAHSQNEYHNHKDSLNEGFNNLTMVNLSSNISQNPANQVINDSFQIASKNPTSDLDQLENNNSFPYFNTSHNQSDNGPLTVQNQNFDSEFNEGATQYKELARAIAKFDFDAQKQNDLSFSKGDLILITEMNKNGWWVGICHNRVGFFPYNYVHIIS